MTHESLRASLSLPALRLDVAATVLTLLGQTTSALCVHCLAEITSARLSTMRATTAGLLEAGSLLMAPKDPCPLCQKHPALWAKGVRGANAPAAPATPTSSPTGAEGGGAEMTDATTDACGDGDVILHLASLLADSVTHVERAGNVRAERLLELVREGVQALEAAASQLAGLAGSPGAGDPEAMRHWLHDVRTPVSTIVGWVRMLGEVFRGEATRIRATGKAFRRADVTFGLRLWHWFFLAQPYDLPERLIGADLNAFYLREHPGCFAPEALEDYRRCFRDQATIHAICEDHRAGATIDFALAP